MEGFAWYIYEYRLVSLLLNIDGVTTVIDAGKIQNIYLEKSYDTDFLPVFMMQILMGTELYHSITNSTNVVTFTVNIKGMIDKDNKGEKEDIHDYINGEFELLPIDNTPFIDAKTVDAINQSPTHGEGGTSMSDFQDGYTFILAKKSDMDNSKKITNTVLSSTNILNAVSYLLSASGCSNVLMTTPDNPTIYNELMLLPIPLVNQLKYLNSYYGLYKHGAQMFFDFDRTYILRNNASCTAFNSTEPKSVVITVYESGSGNQYGKGSYTDNKNRLGYISVGADQFSIDDLSNAGSQYLGNNSLIINNSGEISSATTGGNQSAFNIITTSTHNMYTTEETKLRLSEMQSVATITTTNCDLRLLQPNKYYQIVSSSSKASTALNKPFRLVSVKVLFVKQGDHFDNVTEIVLKASDAS